MGDDVIHGSEFSETIYGNAGNDTLLGYGGGDKLFGGDHDDFLSGGDGADLIDGGSGHDSVSFATSQEGVLVDLQSPDHNSGPGLGDVYLSIEVVTGTGFKDFISGSTYDETLYGGADHDDLFGRDGNDVLSGGEGDDLLVGEFGDDTLFGGDGEDFFLFSLASGHDTIDDFQVGTDYLSFATVELTFDDLVLTDHQGGLFVDYSQGASEAATVHLRGVTSVEFSADDVLFGTFGSGGSETINGTSGTDYLYGLHGNDIINGGAGDDYLFGMGGFDTLNGQSGADTISGGTGNDRFFIDTSDDIVIEEIGEGYDNVTSSVSFTLPENTEQGALKANSPEALSLTGNNLDNWLSGNAYDNQIFDDVGRDRLIGFDGDDSLFGGADVDILQGGEDNDALFGGSGRDILEGDAGSDVLQGDEGRDELRGGSGSDRFLASFGGDIDDVRDFDETEDLIDVSAIGIAFHEIGLGVSSLGTVVTYEFNPSGNGVFILHGVDRASLSYDNFITAYGDTQPVINGTEGNDRLYGSIANDELDGGSGNDSIYGGSGADTMRGGEGDDRFFVEDAGDVIIELAGQGSDDKVTARVTYILPDHVERIGTDVDNAIDLTGNSLANWVTGNDAENVLRGEGGADRIYGYQGSDIIVGGQGNDILYGGGSDGAEDVFVFELGDGSDVIYDFEIGVDRIDLSATGLLFEDIQLISSGANVQVRYYGDGHTDIATVANVQQSDLTVDSFVFA